MNQEKDRVLIVDDDRNICAILAALMKKEGLKPLVAYDGEKALKMVQADVPDLLLVDMMLPGMDGMEVLRKTREIAPDLPVVFITAHTDSRVAVKAIKEPTITSPSLLTIAKSSGWPTGPWLSGDLSSRPGYCRTS